MIKDTSDLDENGHKTGLLIYIRKKVPMSQDGWDRFGRKQKQHIAKSKYVWKPYASSKRDFIKIFPPRGRVPNEHFVTDKAIGEFFLKYLHVTNGDHFAIQSFQNRKTRTHIGFTKHLAEVTIISVENGKYEITKSNSLNRYHFRKEALKNKERDKENY